ncbi:DUF5803 family protein [Halobellus rufus]|uniref:DUF5803 family protein n=1 Tax=Halobellus rufus TaxID=1448860 RepID=UPI0006793B11|nr:DUF5803 family protein [Halobellus rufus]
MNRRLLLAAGCLALLALTSGCLGIGTGPVDAEQLDSEPAAPYDWETNRTAHITVQENTQFRAVFETNSTTIELYREDGFGGTNPIPVESVRYRYPDGTVLTGTEVREAGGEIRRTRDETVVSLPEDAPASGGSLAFTSSGSPKRFTLPTYVDGTYEVVLPPDRRVDFPVFGQVTPRNYDATIDDESRVHIVWTEPVTTDIVSVRFYLQRDLYIFGGIVALVGLVGGGGLLYYRRQIDRLRRQRHEMGIDVEIEDDDDGPPPGMR